MASTPAARARVPNLHLSLARKGSWLDPANVRESLEALVSHCDYELSSLKRDRQTISPAYASESPFIRAVDDMRWFSSALAAGFESEGVHACQEDPSQSGEYRLSAVQEAILEEADNPLLERLDELWRAFEEAATSGDRPWDGELRRTFARIAQRQLYNYLDLSPFVYSSRIPPSGQPGDTLVIRMILGERQIAPTLLGNLIDVWHLRTKVSEAHRNRIAIITDWLENEARDRLSRRDNAGFRLCSLGCGPAREIPRLLNRAAGKVPLGRLEVTLEDYSKEALSTALEAIERASIALRDRPKVTTRRTNAFRLAVAYSAGRSPKLDEAPYDVCYCAGLYDYLDDEVAVSLTKALFHRVAPGGMLLVTNVDPSNPNKAAQELLLNWPLIYRDEEAMKDLGRSLLGGAPWRTDLTSSDIRANPSSLRPGEMCVTQDETGVNQFLWVRAPI